MPLQARRDIAASCSDSRTPRLRAPRTAAPHFQEVQKVCEPPRLASIACWTSDFIGRSRRGPLDFAICRALDAIAWLMVCDR
jgi:hypothetical protein